MTTIAVIPVVVLLLQFSEEGEMRRNGIRVTATVDELASGQDSCVRCPLLFTIDDERYSVEETLVAGNTDDDVRRYVPGEEIELYVDPNDKTHTIEVGAVEENVDLGVAGIVFAVVFAVAWPVYEFRRSIPHSIAPAHRFP